MKHTLALTVSLALTAKASESGPAPCDAHPVFLRNASTWDDMFTMSEMRACLNDIPIDAEARNGLLETLVQQIGTAYVYADIIKNTDKTNAVLDPCYNFATHPSHLNDWITNNLNPPEGVKGHNPAAPAGALWSATSYGGVWIPLTEFSTMMKDAHTVLTSPWGSITLDHGLLSFPPFKFEVSPEGAVRVAPLLAVARNLGWNLYSVKSGSGLPTSSIDLTTRVHEGKTIASINGLAPMAYLKSVVEMTGDIKSAGGRLNAFLRGDQFLTNNIFAAPNAGRLEVSFNDGSSYIGEWKAGFAPDVVAGTGMKSQQSVVTTGLKEQLQSAYGLNPMFDLLNAAFQIAPPLSTPARNRALHETVFPTAPDAMPAVLMDDSISVKASVGAERGARALADEPSAESGVCADPAQGHAWCTDAPPNTVKWEQFTKGEPGTCDEYSVTMFSPSDAAKGDSGEQLSVAVMSQKACAQKTNVIWKLNGFVFPSTNGQPAPSPAHAYHYMTKQATHLAATLSTDDELILDVIGNGGGNVEASAWTRQYFWGAQLATPEEACITVNEAISPLVANLVKNTQAIGDALYQYSLNAADSRDLANVPDILPDKAATATALKSIKTGFDTALTAYAATFDTYADVDSLLTLATTNNAQYMALCKAAGFGVSDINGDSTQECNQLVGLLQLAYNAFIVGTCLSSAVPDSAHGADSCGLLPTLLQAEYNYLGRLFMVNRADLYTGVQVLSPAVLNAAAPYPATELATVSQTFSTFDLPTQSITLQSYLSIQFQQRGTDTASPFTEYYKLNACPQATYAGNAAAARYVVQDPSGAMADGIPSTLFSAALSNPYRAEFQTMISKFKILTDGTCGSACSQFISLPYLKGFATVVSYGGFQGEPMDISAFQAGNVEKFADNWPKYTVSSIVANAFRTPTTAAEGWWPLATHSSATYSRTATIYPEILGPEALWREWYILPAQHHLPYYVGANYDPKNMKLGWPALSQLYQMTSDREQKTLSSCPTATPPDGPSDKDEKSDKDETPLTVAAFVIAVLTLVGLLLATIAVCITNARHSSKQPSVSASGVQITTTSNAA